MRARLLRLALAGVVALVVFVGAIAVLHFGFGLRLMQTGSGMPWPTFAADANAHDQAVERHRAAQQTSAPAPQPAADATPAAAPAADAPASTNGTPAPAPGKEAGAATATATPAAAASPAPGGAPAAAAPAAPAAPAVAAYWTDFRGPRRDGRYAQTPIATSWPQQGLRPLWKQPIGAGYASFVVAGGHLFTIEQRRDREIVASYDAETGRELWTHGWNAAYRDPTGDGPRATPTWHEGRVYALGARGDLQVLDARTGKPIWQKNIIADNGGEHLNWGSAASPLVVDDKVIVLPGGPDGKSVVAYHKDTGARVWSVLNDRQAYTAPMIATLGGIRQIVVVSARRAMGLRIEDGQLLWEHPWVTDFGVNAAQPIVIGDNRVYVSAGYGHGATVLELTPAGDRFSVKVVWQNIRMKNKFTSSVLHEGHIYGLDEAILACIDAATGELKWKGGRYGYGQTIFASGHLIVTAENGDLALVRATPDSHQEVARFSAIEGKTWNHPALADGRLFVRNGNEMAAFDLRPGQ